MKRLFLHLLLVVRYYPIGAVFAFASLVVLIFMLLLPQNALRAALVYIFPVISVASILLLIHNTSFRAMLFKSGELSKTAVLEVINTLMEIETQIPARNIYLNRPKRPWLFYILWSKGHVHRRLLQWMGVDPNSVRIEDGHLTFDGIAGTADSHNGTITISSRIKENHPDAYLATLVHEISHMLEARIGDHSYITAFEEDFTDTLCVFLGLGDVMLNGCVSMHQEEIWCGAYVKRRCEKQQVGYLLPYQLAIAETLVIEISRCYGSVRKHYNPHSYSLLTKTRIWLRTRGVRLGNPKKISTLDYLRQIKAQVERMP